MCIIAIISNISGNMTNALWIIPLIIFLIEGYNLPGLTEPRPSGMPFFGIFFTSILSPPIWDPSIWDPSMWTRPCGPVHLLHVQLRPVHLGWHRKGLIPAISTDSRVYGCVAEKNFQLLLDTISIPPKLTLHFLFINVVYFRVTTWTNGRSSLDLSLPCSRQI